MELLVVLAQKNKTKQKTYLQEVHSEGFKAIAASLNWNNYLLLNWKSKITK